MSTPVALRLPATFQRVQLDGRHGRIAAVQGRSDHPCGAALLLPGLTGSKEDYFAILGPLLDLGWTVTAIDLPGQYESAGAAEPSGYTLPDLGEEINAIAAQVAADGQRLHLIGHSVGGLIAREAVLAEPQRWASLTLYASGQAHLGDRASSVLTGMDQLLRAMPVEQVYDLKRAADQAAGRPDPDPEIDAFMRERMIRTGAAHLRGLGLIGRTAPDRIDELAAVRERSGLPMLVLYGAHDDDTWNTADFAELAERLACPAVVVPDAEHSPAVEDPETMIVALDAFWRSVSAPQ